MLNISNFLLLIIYKILFRVRSYPTIEVFSADSNAESVRFNGDMELNKLANFAVKHMESFV